MQNDEYGSTLPPGAPITSQFLIPAVNTAMREYSDCGDEWKQMTATSSETTLLPSLPHLKEVLFSLLTVLCHLFLV